MKLKLTEMRCNDDHCFEKDTCERYRQRMFGCKAATMFPGNWRAPGERCINRIPVEKQESEASSQ